MSKKYHAERPKWNKERILALRHHLGLTQQGLADQLGTRQQTISEWEIGVYQPRGASATLLSLIAKEAKFEYDPSKKDSPAS
jgi:DNA-binding transcriptional regulator YiaG